MMKSSILSDISIRTALKHYRENHTQIPYFYVETENDCDYTRTHTSLHSGFPLL
jgi:hypothetical protein